MKTIPQIASERPLQPDPAVAAPLLDVLPEAFYNRRPQLEEARDDIEAALYRQVGQIKLDLNWPKKNSGASVEMKLAEVEPEHPKISVVRQCELLGLFRSSFYYIPCGEDEYNLMLMFMIDQRFTRHTLHKPRRMRAWLRTRGYRVNRKRVSRLMRLTGSPSLLVLDSEYNELIERRLVEDLRDKLDRVIIILIERVDKILRSPNGKFILVISKANKLYPDPHYNIG